MEKKEQWNGLKRKDEKCVRRTVYHETRINFSSSMQRCVFPSLKCGCVNNIIQNTSSWACILTHSPTFDSLYIFSSLFTRISLFSSPSYFPLFLSFLFLSFPLLPISLFFSSWKNEFFHTSSSLKSRLRTHTFWNERGGIGTQFVNQTKEDLFCVRNFLGGRFSLSLKERAFGSERKRWDSEWKKAREKERKEGRTWEGKRSWENERQKRRLHNINQWHEYPDTTTVYSKCTNQEEAKMIISKIEGKKRDEKKGRNGTEERRKKEWEVERESSVTNDLRKSSWLLPLLFPSIFLSSSFTVLYLHHSLTKVVLGYCYDHHCFHLDHVPSLIAFTQRKDERGWSGRVRNVDGEEERERGKIKEREREEKSKREREREMG